MDKSDRLSLMIVPATNLRIVLTTAGSREEADRIANALVEQGLAACVNQIAGVASIYFWKGELERAEEFLLVIKTAADRVPQLEAVLHTMHSYETPEFIVIAPDSATRNYYNWALASSTRMSR